MIKALAHWLASRPRKRPPTTVVLHATGGGSALSSIAWLRKIGLSYSYVIEDDGTVIKCVPATRVAFHAGKSTGPEGPDVNSYSVGIAFAHRNTPDEPYTEAALAACRDLVGELKRAYPSLKWLCTHYAVTVMPDGTYRKSDPVNFIYMQRVADGNLAPWRPAHAKNFALPV